jgi:hypothetical protein
VEASPESWLIRVRILSFTVDEMSKIELKELKGVLTKEGYAGLKGVLWALRKRHENLAPQE